MTDDKDARTKNQAGIDPKLLEMLVCPLTKNQLKLDAVNCELISPSAKLAYPVRDGIPILLPSQAREMSD